MTAKHWANIGESTFVTGTWCLFAVYRLFGRWPFRLLMYPVMLYYWSSRRIARQSSLQYLKRVQEKYAPFKAMPGRWQSFLHFLQFGETLLDKLIAVSGQYPKHKVELVGQQQVWSQLDSTGKGVVMVTTHMGCLELMQYVATWRPNLAINILVHTAHAENFNRILQRLDPKNRMRFIQVTQFDMPTAMSLSARLEAGEVIAIAGDRVPVQGDRVAYADFLGHKAAFPIGPYIFSLLTGADIYVAACLHHGAGYRMHIEKLYSAQSIDRKQRDAQTQMLVEEFSRWLESCVQKSPTDWFNFFPFWDQVATDAK